MEEKFRKLTNAEEKLIEALITKAKLIVNYDWRNQTMVFPMDDGKMGSLYLRPNQVTNTHRRLGQMVSDLVFKDQDEVTVLASLYIDDTGELFELDIWKTDFSSLIHLSEDFE